MRERAKEKRVEDPLETYMQTTIMTKNPRRLICFLFGLFFFMVIGLSIFDRQYTQIFSYPSISYIMVQKKDSSAISPPTFDFTPHIYQPLNTAVLRGLLVFYPDDQEAHFLSELLWFVRSWIEMMKEEAPLWRTDLVIYTGNYTLNLQKLGCVFNKIRTNRHEPPQCRVFLYERIRLRDRNKPSNYSYQQIDRRRSVLLMSHLNKYDYADSIVIISECYPSFSMYDYILRTDLDVFLTKYFGRFVPKNRTILVGGGAYSTQFNSKRLQRVAKEMDWSYARLSNLGSTW